MTGKNKKGGSGHKRMARKFLKPNNITRKLREAKRRGNVCQITELMVVEYVKYYVMI